MPVQVNADPYFEINVDGVATEDLRVKAYRGSEIVSGLFEYEFELLSDQSNLEPAQFLGKVVTMLFNYDLGGPENKETVTKYGLISEFGVRGKTPHYFEYRCKIVPRLWWLTLNQRNYVYQQMNIQQLVTHLLSENEEYELAEGQDFEFQLNGNYPLLEYAVQYQESDLQFLNRRLEHFGIFYYFSHQDGCDKVIFADHNDGFGDIADPATIRFRTDADPLDNTPYVLGFSANSAMNTGAVHLREWNDRLTEKLDGRATTNIAAGGSCKYYSFGENFADADQATFLAQRRMEELDCRRTVYVGSTTSRIFRAGHRFVLTYPDMAAWHEKRFILTAVHQQGSQAGLFPHLQRPPGVDSPSYECRFDAVEMADIPFRPIRKTPQPRIPGILSATIESNDAEDKYGYLEPDGSYRARMHYDISDAEPAQASLPVRLNQPYSGPGYGIHFPNHHGTEILLAHVQGDPDRPVGVGTIPNPANASPSIANNREQSVIQTAGHNSLIFDDTEKEENILLTATKDNTISVGDNRSASVTTNDSLSVGADRSASVGGNDTLAVTGERKVTIDSNRTVTIGGTSETTITMDHKETLKAKRTVDVTADDTEKYGAKRKIDVTGDETRTVGGKEQLTVTGDCAIQVTGKVTINGDGDVEISGPTIKLTGMKEISLAVGPSSIKLSPAGVEISGPKVTSAAQAINEITGATIKLN